MPVPDGADKININETLEKKLFLIFTKKGTIEIAFKQVHYTSLLITTIVGLTSIVYWSAKGIYSAIDVAKKNDIITEASANINDGGSVMGGMEEGSSDGQR